MLSGVLKMLVGLAERRWRERRTWRQPLGFGEELLVGVFGEPVRMRDAFLLVLFCGENTPAWFIIWLRVCCVMGKTGWRKRFRHIFFLVLDARFNVSYRGKSPFRALTLLNEWKAACHFILRMILLNQLFCYWETCRICPTRHSLVSLAWNICF